MQTKPDSTSANPPRKPYAALRELCRSAMFSSKQVKIDEYHLMAILVRQTFGKAYYDCACDSQYALQAQYLKNGLGPGWHRFIQWLRVTEGANRGRLPHFMVVELPSQVFLKTTTLLGDELWLHVIKGLRLGIYNAAGGQCVKGDDKETQVKYLRTWLDNPAMQLADLQRELSPFFSAYNNDSCEALSEWLSARGDKDARNKGQQYDALARSFRTSWESAFRGHNVE